MRIDYKRLERLFSDGFKQKLSRQDKKRQAEGLFYMSPNIIHGSRYRENCFYCKKTLRVLTSPMHSSGETCYRRDYFCDKCNLRYNLPVSASEQRECEEHARTHIIS